MKRKSPFRGIAHSNGSSYGPRYFRHIEGARDVRPAWPKRRRDQRMNALLSAVFDKDATPIQPFCDINPVPVSFCE